MSSTSNMRVLIVFKDMSMQLLVKSYLNVMGLQHVTTASNGERALIWLEDQAVDLVLADRFADEQDGLALLQSIRASKINGSSSFVMVSGDSSQPAVMESIRAGTDDFLLVPFNFNILAKKIARLTKPTYHRPEQPILEKYISEDVISQKRRIEAESNTESADSTAAIQIEAPVVNKPKQVVLVVDDVPSNIDVISGVLSTVYKIKAANNGEKALKIISASPPDLVLLDIMMPEMDGYETLRRINDMKLERDLPVIFLSAKSEVVDITRGLEMGAVDYVTKPANPDILKARVKTHLKLSSANRNLQSQVELLVDNLNLRDDIELLTQQDLKVPLNEILHLCHASKLGDGSQASFVEIEKSAKLGLTMLNSSIDLYRIERESYLLQPEEVDLHEIVKTLIQDWGPAIDRHSLGVKYYQRAKEAKVVAEKALCYSAFSHLIKNAIEASTEHQTVTLTLDLQDGSVVLSIHNQTSIPEAARYNPFEKYLTTGKKNHVGLGCYAAKRLIEFQGGKINFDTSDEKGTTFSLTFDVA